MTANLNFPLPNNEVLGNPNPAPSEIQKEDFKAAAGNLKKRGTKEEVFNGLALQTGGGLRKADLLRNKRGAVVSKKRSEQGLKQFKNIENYIQEKKKNKAKEKEEQDQQSSQEEETEPPKKKQDKPLELKPEAVQEEKHEEPEKSNSLSASQLPNIIKPIERKKRGRKIKDEGPLIEEIKH